MKYKTILFLCLICLMFSGFGILHETVTAVGNTYYVATTGSDSNPGTLSKPWLTIQHAVDTATTAGDTVNIMAGNYTTPALVFSHSGSAVGGYITFQNYANGMVNITINDDDWSGVNTNGKDYLKLIGLNFTGDERTQYGIFIYQSDYITVQNCAFTNTLSSGIQPNSSTYVTIDGCHLTDVCNGYSEEMISVVNCDHFEIKNCTLHDPGSESRCGIDIKEGCSNGSVHDNEVYNLSGWYPTGIYVDARGDTSNIAIYNNKVHDIPQGYGIEVGDETATTLPSAISNINIYNNIIYKCYLSGFTLVQRGKETFTNVYFINNTLYWNANNTGDPEIYVTANPTYTTNCIIRNNIVYGAVNNSCPIYDSRHAYAGGKLLIDHNLFYNSGGSWGLSADYIMGNNYVEGNPLFTNVPTNLSIPTGSPAKNAGSPTLAPSTDYIGTSRPQGTGNDIGAYEYQISSTVALAITTNELPNGTAAVAYSQTLVATGGSTPYTWTIASGSLPTGLSLSSSGVISGTPTTAMGPTSIIFRVTDSANATATKTLTITIVAYAVWDVNTDGVVNVLDMINTSQHWGESGTAGWIRADVNSDGQVNSLDMIIIGQHWTG